MAKNTNFICDGCGKVLWGRDRAAYIKRDSLQINGQILEKTVDPKTEYEELVFITPSRTESLSFCNFDCLKDYIGQRRAQWKIRKEQMLREQATDEYQERLDNGGINFVRTRRAPESKMTIRSTCYPLEYRTIPTQYCFLVSQTENGYEVKIHATADLSPKLFKTEAEARRFINRSKII